MNKLILINVCDDDCDYQYKNSYLVKENQEQLKRLKFIKKDCKELDEDERFQKYGEESIIVIVENYIINNFEIVNVEQINIDC
jgi:hypothetical protein